MSFKKQLVLSSACLVLGACSYQPVLTENPVPTNFKQESMHKLNSIAHWNHVALDVTRDVTEKYSKGKFCIPGSGCELNLFVKPQAHESQFSRAFRSQLTSALVDMGLPVVIQPDAKTVIVDLDIQVVPVAASGNKVEYDREPTELTEGVWVIKDLPNSFVTPFKGNSVEQWSEGKAKRDSWFKSAHFVPAGEMLVTVSFVKGTSYMARTSNMYYLSNLSGYLPKQSSNQGGGDGAKTGGIARIELVGDCTPGRCEVK